LKGAVAALKTGETEDVEQDEFGDGMAVEQFRAADSIVQSYAKRPDKNMSRLTNGHQEQLVGSACEATHSKEKNGS
jgi:hypothetical protein